MSGMCQQDMRHNKVVISCFGSGCNRGRRTGWSTPKTLNCFYVVELLRPRELRPYFVSVKQVRGNSMSAVPFFPSRHIFPCTSTRTGEAMLVYVRLQICQSLCRQRIRFQDTCQGLTDEGDDEKNCQQHFVECWILWLSAERVVGQLKI